LAKEPVKKLKTSHNISMDPDVLIEFYKYATPMGIKLSAWVQAMMAEFISDAKELEEIKARRKSIH